MKKNDIEIRLVHSGKQVKVVVERGEENPALALRTLLKGAVAFLAAQANGQLTEEEKKEFAQVFGETMEGELLEQLKLAQGGQLTAMEQKPW